MEDAWRTDDIDNIRIRPNGATYESKLLSRGRGGIEITAQVPCGLVQGSARALDVSANQCCFRPARQRIISIERGAIRAATGSIECATSANPRAFAVARQQ